VAKANGDGAQHGIGTIPLRRSEAFALRLHGAGTRSGSRSTPATLELRLSQSVCFIKGKRLMIRFQNTICSASAPVPPAARSAPPAMPPGPGTARRQVRPTSGSVAGKSGPRPPRAGPVTSLRVPGIPAPAPAPLRAGETAPSQTSSRARGQVQQPMLVHRPSDVCGASSSTPPDP